MQRRAFVSLLGASLGAGLVGPAWAAGLMGLEGDAAEDYAKTVVMADFEEAGDDDVYRKVKADLDAKGVEVSENQVRREMEQLLDVARQQLTA